MPPPSNHEHEKSSNGFTSMHEFKPGLNFALGQWLATCCQHDTAEAHWLEI